MTTNPPLAPRRPASIATIVAFVGLVALTVGWFLPWGSHIDMRGAVMSGPEFDRMADPRSNAGAPADVAEVARRIRDSGSASGRDLVVVGSFWVDHRGSAEPRERRAWKIALFAGKAAPFAAAFLALLLLLGRLSKPSSPVLGLLLAFAIAASCLAALLVLGASENAKSAVTNDPSLVGIGLYALLGGCLATLVGAFGSMRTSTWWKALLLGLALLIGAIAAIVALLKAA